MTENNFLKSRRQTVRLECGYKKLAIKRKSASALGHPKKIRVLVILNNI
jgi:hypothetical protein